jgi:hypothetical protein
MFRLKRRIRRFLMQRIKKIFQQHGMSLCAHFLRSQLDGVGAVTGAVEHEWSQQTLKTIVILFAKFRGTSNHDEQSERWPLLQIANSSRRDCGSFSAPQPTAILFYRACPQLA